MVIEVLNRWFIEIVEEVKVQPPAHTAVVSYECFCWHQSLASCWWRMGRLLWRGGWDGCPALGHW